jgi:hypothetical protein
MLPMADGCCCVFAIVWISVVAVALSTPAVSSVRPVVIVSRDLSKNTLLCSFPFVQPDAKESVCSIGSARRASETRKVNG